KGWEARELVDQVELVRKQDGAGGGVHFSMKALMRNPGGVADALKKTYAEPALGPESPWLASRKPRAKPEVTRETADGKPVLRIKAPAGTRFVVVRTEAAGGWATRVIGGADEGPTTVPLAGSGRVVVSVLDRTSRASEAVEVAQ